MALECSQNRREILELWTLAEKSFKKWKGKTALKKSAQNRYEKAEILIFLTPVLYKIERETWVDRHPRENIGKRTQRDSSSVFLGEK
jgi:hypothetical protein